jgi:hypothetical protein
VDGAPDEVVRKVAMQLVKIAKEYPGG